LPIRVPLNTFCLLDLALTLLSPFNLFSYLVSPVCRMFREYHFRLL
jgi:hypothetical protein